MACCTVDPAMDKAVSLFVVPIIGIVSDRFFERPLFVHESAEIGFETSCRATRPTKGIHCGVSPLLVTIEVKIAASVPVTAR